MYFVIINVLYTFFAVEIIEKVRDCNDCSPFRPSTRVLACDKYIIDCMQCCWNETPDERQDFRTIRKVLEPMRNGM